MRSPILVIYPAGKPLAIQNNLTISEIKEYFEDSNTTPIPRILPLKFRKSNN